MKTNNLKFFPGFLYMLLLTSVGCNNKSSSAPYPLFVKCWTNAFEEESQDNTRIYRPCLTHTFPIARYRNTFTLKENEEAEYSVLAPNDAHTTEQGTWSYDPQSKKLRISNQANAVVNEYEVLEIHEDLLRLKE